MTTGVRRHQAAGSQTLNLSRLVVGGGKGGGSRWGTREGLRPPFSPSTPPPPAILFRSYIASLRRPSLLPPSPALCLEACKQFHFSPPSAVLEWSSLALGHCMEYIVREQHSSAPTFDTKLCLKSFDSQLCHHTSVSNLHTKYMYLRQVF